MRYTSFLDIWMKNPLPKDAGKPAREDFLTLRAGSVPSSFKEVRNTSEEGKDQSLRLQAAAPVLGIVRLIIKIIRLF